MSSKIKCASTTCQCKAEDNVGGTPRTLLGAIENGLRDPSHNGLSLDAPAHAQIIQEHVLDYLRQTFSVLELTATPAQAEVVQAVAGAISAKIYKWGVNREG